MEVCNHILIYLNDVRADLKYGSARDSPKQYYTPHTRLISKAAVVYDAKAIRKQLLGLRHAELFGQERSGPGVDHL